MPWLSVTLPLSLPLPLLTVYEPLEIEPWTDLFNVVCGIGRRTLIQSLAECPISPQL